MVDRVRCCAVTERSSKGIGPYQCSRWAVATRDGKAYCWQHDPIAEQPGGTKRTLSRDTAIKVVEAAGDMMWIESADTAYHLKMERLSTAIVAAKQELGI